MINRYGLSELYAPPDGTKVTAQYVCFHWAGLLGPLSVWVTAVI